MKLISAILLLLPLTNATAQSEYESLKADANSGNLLAGIAAAAPASIAGHAAGDRGSDTGNEKEFLSLVQNGRAL